MTTTRQCLILLAAICLSACGAEEPQSQATANVPKSEFTEGSSWNMCGSTTTCDQTFPITVVAINGETLTLKMPAGTLDVPQSQLQIVSRENRTVRIIAKAR